MTAKEVGSDHKAGGDDDRTEQRTTLDKRK